MKKLEIPTNKEHYEMIFKECLESDETIEAKTKPFKYSSVKVMAEKCVEYFVFMTSMQRPLIVSGLQLHLGFNSRANLDSYLERGGGFEKCLDIAKQICEAYAEESLFDAKKTSGGKFCLMNRWRWSNQEKVEQTIKMEYEIGMDLDEDEEEDGEEKVPESE